MQGICSKMEILFTYNAIVNKTGRDQKILYYLWWYNSHYLLWCWNSLAHFLMHNTQMLSWNSILIKLNFTLHQLAIHTKNYKWPSLIHTLDGKHVKILSKEFKHCKVGIWTWDHLIIEPTFYPLYNSQWPSNVIYLWFS